MHASAPASSANLGPGFDTLALALDLRVEVNATIGEPLQIISKGFGSEVIVDDSHLALRTAQLVLGHNNVRIEINSAIPLARGLGSSAALALATAAACGAKDPFAIAAAIDGHPENAAASFMGGFVTATMLESSPVGFELRIDPSIVLVAVIPDMGLSTKKAREVLPSQIPYEDASFNLGRMGMLIAGMAEVSQLVAEAGQDRLHQSQRTGLFPESKILLEQFIKAGSKTSFWSGAGPTLVGVAQYDKAQDIAAKMEQVVNNQRLKAKVDILQVDKKGLIVEGKPWKS